jgi:hypothetical protein
MKDVVSPLTAIIVGMRDRATEDPSLTEPAAGAILLASAAIAV